MDPGLQGNPLVPPPTLHMTREQAQETDFNHQRQRFKDRVALFENALQTKFQINDVQKLAFSGIPDSPGLRSLYWKILLNYLPTDRTQWENTLNTSRMTYKGWTEELVVDPRKTISEDDHPLSTAQTSQWHLFFKDKELIEEIDKDVKRTLPGLHFFNHDKQVGETKHYEALKRILFIYAKLNPGIRYVQGMNEILGPLYYIFASDPAQNFKENAEADTFFCFTNLMAEIRDNFCKTLDKSELGITGLMNTLNQLLKAKDQELWQDFEEKSLNPQFYSFRWLTLLLSQEFELPDVLRLWDSLFADSERFQFLLYVCVSMLVCIRDQLLDGSFSDNLKMLQGYPLQDIHTILGKAEELSEESYIPPPPRPKPVQKDTPQQTTQTSFLQRIAGTATKGTEGRSSFKQTEIIKEDEENFMEEPDLPVQPLYRDFPKPFDHSSDEETDQSHPLA